MAIVNNNTNVHLSAAHWAELDSLIAALKPAAIVTKQFQSPSLTLTDFFGIWINLRLKMQQMVNSSNIVQQLFNAIKARENSVLANPIVLAAVCLHPRLKVLLSNDQTQLAINVLINLWERLKKIKSKRDDALNELEESGNSWTGNNSALELYLLQMENAAGLSNRGNSTDAIENESTSHDLKKIIDTFVKSKQSSANQRTGIIDFWLKRKASDPELYQLACIVNNIPATQVVVERNFSGLACILTPKRTNLLDQNLENILLCKLNPDVFYELLNEKLERK